MRPILLPVTREWDTFWFQPRSSHVLALMRIFTGLMLAYMHFVWLLRVDDFFGVNSLIPNDLSRRLHRDDYVWTYLWSVESSAFAVAHQCLAIALGLLVAAGLLTRLALPLAWFVTLMVCHRMTGFLFGLDQVVMMLSMYLMLAPAGSLWSLDARLARKLNAHSIAWLRWLFPPPTPSSMTTLATRLIQIHLCIVYLFGGLAKLRGEMWWDGSAMWFSAASYEYQSLDLTWLGRFPLVAAILTHVTVFWETFYCFLIWRPRWRPIMLMISVAVHGGIALFLGMVTFGWMMIVANMAFIFPEEIEEILNRWRGTKIGRAVPRLVVLFAIGLVLGSWCSYSIASNENSLSSDQLIAIFRDTHDGWSLDEVLLEDTRRAKLLAAARKLDPSVDEKEIWEGLVRLRKGGKLDVKTTQRATQDRDAPLPVAEIAARRMQDEFNVTFDQVLIDATLLHRYDEIARAIDPQADVYSLRKAALRLRKSRQLRPELVSRVTDWNREILVWPLKEIAGKLERIPAKPGVYIFRDATGYLYIGQSNNLKERLSKHLTDSDRKSLAAYLAEASDQSITLEVHVFLDGSPGEKTIVREAYESDLIRTRKPRLNLSP